MIGLVRGDGDCGARAYELTIGEVELEALIRGRVLPQTVALARAIWHVMHPGTPASAAGDLLRDPCRLWALVRQMRAQLYADGLITIDECAALLDDEAGA